MQSLDGGKILTKAACAKLGSIQHALMLASRDACAASLSQSAKFLPFSPTPVSDDFINVDSASADRTREGCVKIRVFGS